MFMKNLYLTVGQRVTQAYVKQEADSELTPLQPSPFQTHYCPECS